MESFIRNFRGGTDWNMRNFLSFTTLSPKVQEHLQKVYLTLTGALLVSTFAVYGHVLLGLGGLISTLGFVVSMFWLLSVPPTNENEVKRLTLLGFVALFQGLSMGPLVSAAFLMDPRLVAAGSACALAIFVCFSGAAILSRQRKYILLGGLLSSAVSTLALLRMMSFWFGGYLLVFQLEVYIGLIIFAGYVLFDTQVIIAKAERGDKDYIRHTLDLFIDLAAIFVRVLIILMKNSEKRAREEEKRRSNSRRYD